MAACNEVFVSCGENLFCAADKTCRLKSEDIPHADPCGIQNYMLILLVMFVICLAILSTVLWIRHASQKKIENVMKKYHLKNERALEETLKNSITHRGSGNDGFTFTNGE
ncbi:uncharacterized protein LOC132547712 [Ylistrum balloti]|uniref:uncharacterized protein LOC132547712 n=1 Tax=Ylistrum balloti TaxID=509963 RepID=UPI002905E69D|nr:uncharacterized protein LOC132547712 [Ylistrum balloti]